MVKELLLLSLTEDLGSVPITHTVVHNHLQLSSRGFDTFF